MAESAGNLSIGVKVDFSSLNRQLKRVHATAAKMSKGIDANLKRTFNNLARVAERAALGVGVAMTAITVSSLKAASSAEEISAKFDTVFRELSDDANKFANDFSKSVGRANQEV